MQPNEPTAAEDKGLPFDLRLIREIAGMIEPRNPALSDSLVDAASRIESRCESRDRAATAETERRLERARGAYDACREALEIEHSRVLVLLEACREAARHIDMTYDPGTYAILREAIGNATEEETQGDGKTTTETSDAE